MVLVLVLVDARAGIGFASHLACALADCVFIYFNCLFITFEHFSDTNPVEVLSKNCSIIVEILSRSCRECARQMR